MKTLDKVLVFLSVFMILFIVAVLIVFWKTGNEPSVLVGGVTAAVVAEILACLRIKIGKQRGKDPVKQNDDTV